MRGQLAEASQTRRPAQFLSPTRTGPKKSMTTFNQSITRRSAAEPRRTDAPSRRLRTSRDTCRRTSSASYGVGRPGDVIRRVQQAALEVHRDAGVRKRRAKGAHLFVQQRRSAGQRKDSERPDNGLENLMLVCHQCHQKIDAEEETGTGYTPRSSKK